MLKLKLGFLVLTIFCISNAVSAQSFDYAFRLGSTNSTLEQGEVLATDDTGNVFIAGQFSGATDFDPSSGVFQLSPSGGNGFIAKYDSSGALVWAKMFDSGLNGGGISFGDIALEENGNIVLTGHFTGEIDFDPSSSTNLLTHFGGTDLFVVKLKANGDYKWVKQFGGSSNAEGNGVVLDTTGNIYVAGHFASVLFWRPINLTNRISSASFDGLIIKLDSLGSLVWIEQIGGPSSDLIDDIEMDSNGDLYTTGIFQNTVDFNPGSGTFNMSAGSFNSAFILKIDQDANFIWAKAFRGAGTVDPYDLEIGPSDEVYSVGIFLDSTDFDPSPINSVVLSNDAIWSSYISKLNSNGDFIWTKKIEGQGGIHPNSLFCDNSNNLHIAGFFGVELDLYPGSPSLRIPSAGFADIFYLKLDSAGQFCSMRNYGNVGLDVAEDIIVDASNNIYITGAFARTIDFDAGPGLNNLQSFGQLGSDAFLLKLKPNSCPLEIRDTIIACDSLIWVNNQRIDTTSNLEVGLIVGANGLDTLVFSNTIINKSSYSTDSIVSCDSIQWIDGNTYTSSDTTAQYTLVSSSGCDSTVSLNLKIIDNETIDTLVACARYTWTNGITYFSDTLAVDTLSSSLGCDSIIFLNLTILPIAQSTDSILSCDSYTWINGVTYFSSILGPTDTLMSSSGCDSIISLHLEITASDFTVDSISSCGPYTWVNGLTYFSSTTLPTDTLLNKSGCDSIVTLDLRLTTLDTSLTIRNDSIFSNAINTTYQWFSCHTVLNKIQGANSRYYSPNKSGFYAVAISGADCVDTSNCILFSGIGLEQDLDLNKVKVYPNPSSGLVHLELGTLRNIDLKLINSRGQIIWIEDQVNGPVYEFEVSVSKGLYFLEITHGESSTRMKIYFL